MEPNDMWACNMWCTIPSRQTLKLLYAGVYARQKKFSHINLAIKKELAINWLYVFLLFLPCGSRMPASPPLRRWSRQRSVCVLACLLFHVHFDGLALYYL